MSSSDLAATLRVEAELPTTHIEIFDAKFRRLPLAANAGVIELLLPPGAYKVFFGEAGASTSTSVIVGPGDTTVVRQPAPIAFASAIPMPGTSTWQRWHEQGLISAWNDRVVTLGPGDAEIFVFVRDLGYQGDDGRWPDRLAYAARDPMPHLRLCSESKINVLELDRPGLHWAAPADHCAGARIRLPAGTWRLRVSGDATEMALTACGGWTTHIYCLAQRLNDGTFRIDLSQATLAMTRIDADVFASWTPFRIRETAFSALRAGYLLRGPAPIQALCHDFDDPLLGIVGAHLLLMDKKEDVDMDSFDSVVRRLQELVGGDAELHPDILMLRARSRLTPQQVRFSSPPLFSRSWRLMLQTARSHPNSIPRSSAVNEVAPAIFHASPWLMWSSRLATWRTQSKTTWGIKSTRPRVAAAAYSSFANRETSAGVSDLTSSDTADIELTDVLGELTRHLDELEHTALVRLHSRLILYLPVAQPLFMALRPGALEENDIFERATLDGLTKPSVNELVDKLPWPRTTIVELAEEISALAVALQDDDVQASFLYHAIRQRASFDSRVSFNESHIALQETVALVWSADAGTMRRFLEQATHQNSMLSVDVVDAVRPDISMKKMRSQSTFLRIAILDNTGTEDRRLNLPLKPLDSEMLRFVSTLPSKGAPNHAYEQLSARDALALIAAESDS